LEVVKPDNRPSLLQCRGRIRIPRRKSTAPPNKQTNKENKRTKKTNKTNKTNKTDKQESAGRRVRRTQGATV
jgi:hypothetical protein